MGVRPILLWPDARLSRTCSAVAPGEALGSLIEDLLDTMYAAKGRGLAAPQIGVMKRVFVIDPTWRAGPRNPMAFINPTIVDQSVDQMGSSESCLSLPGIDVVVQRPDWVKVRFQDDNGIARQRDFTGFPAIAIQHECDHLDGIVVFDRAAPDERERAEAAYGGGGS